MSDKRAALQTIIGKLAKLIPLLASDKLGEVLNAVQAIKNLLASAGLDLHDLVTLISGEEKSIFELLRLLFEKDDDILLRLGRAGTSLFHSQQGAPFADVIVSNHRVSWQLTSPEFEDWLLHQFFLEQRRAPTASAMRNAIRSLSAHAKFEGDQHDVHLRAADAGGRIYLDLGDEEWRAVEIDEVDWRVVEKPPVRFRRTPGMRPLPLPRRGGSIHQLRRFVNLNESDFILLVGVLLDALRPGEPHPALYLAGDEGTAKSTLARIVRLLTDPSSTPLRTLPANVRDLFVSAHSNYALSFDNISKITPAVSDGLCQISSGSGFGIRKLYTDSAEFLVDGSRPVVLNGLANSITRSDLADRAVVLNLAPIKQEGRRSEAEFWNDFEAERPHIFGAMLDALVHGLREEPRVRPHLHRLPRMADFVIRSVACEGAFAAEGAFLRAFEASAVETTETLIEHDCVATAVRAFMIERNSWDGTATQLLLELTNRDRTEAQVSKWASWPRNPSLFSNHLRTVAASLRKVGIEISFDKKTPDRRRTRIIELSKIEQEARAQQSERRARRPALTVQPVLRTLRTPRTDRTVLSGSGDNRPQTVTD
jgi:hypothetical protein